MRSQDCKLKMKSIFNWRQLSGFSQAMISFYSLYCISVYYFESQYVRGGAAAGGSTLLATVGAYFYQPLYLSDFCPDTQMVCLHHHRLILGGSKGA